MDKKTEYTAMDDRPPRRPTKEYDGNVVQPADPPENQGGSRGGGPDDSRSKGSSEPPENVADGGS